jgi:hypothetical protein
VGGELFHADGRTDKHDEVNNRFSHFALRLKMIVLVSIFLHEVISIFQSDVFENCTLLGYCAASRSNSLSTFRDNLSIPSARVKNPRIRNYHYSLPNKQPRRAHFYSCAGMVRNWRLDSRHVH